MVIPLHDQNPTRRRPVVTWALIAVNVVAFLVSPFALVLPGTSSSSAQQCRQIAFLSEHAAIPDELLHDQQLAQAPTGEAVQTPQGPGCSVSAPAQFHKNVLASVLTAMFLHGGWLHLGGNMLYLLIFGNNVEDRLGRLKYLLFYLVAGVVATYGFALADPSSTSPLIGASGAIAGVLGAYLILYPKARVWSLVPFLFFIPLKLPAWLVLGLWFVLQYAYASGVGLTSGADQGVAYLAHVIGFVLGVLVGLTVRRRSSGPPARRREQPAW